MVVRPAIASRWSVNRSPGSSVWTLRSPPDRSLPQSNSSPKSALINDASLWSSCRCCSASQTPTNGNYSFDSLRLTPSVWGVLSILCLHPKQDSVRLGHRQAHLLLRHQQPTGQPTLDHLLLRLCDLHYSGHQADRTQGPALLDHFGCTA